MLNLRDSAMLRLIALLCLVFCGSGFSGRPQEAARMGASGVDFVPQKGWQVQGPIKVRSDGRISLVQGGHALVWKSVELDVDEFPIMLVRTAQSFPRMRWAIAVERSESPALDEKRAIRLLDKFAEEGGFIVALKKLTGWSGKVKFRLMIVLDGHKDDWIEFGNLEAVRLSVAKPAPPRLSAPANGFVLSPMALHFCWYQMPNAVAYQLEVSRVADFSGSKSFEVRPPYLADKLPYLPGDEELLPPGKWFWRVRAINVAGQSGDWSETGTFTVKEAAGPRPPLLSVGAAHPLIVVMADAQRLVDQWNSLPTELKAYVVFRIEVLPTEELQKVLQVAQEHHVPLVFQASGPHDYYGPVSSRISLAEIEAIFSNFPVVKGVYICEQAFRVSPTNNRIMMDYARRLIPLAAEYGRMVLWADGHWGRNLWIDVGLNEKLVETMRKYRQYFIPLWKMNGALTPYSAHDAVLGLWVSRGVDNWGVQPERWYWYEAGFGKLNQQGWFKEGEMADYPRAFYGQMVLLGLSGGASVYSFEPPDDVWGRAGSLSQTSQQVTFPLLSEMIRRRWIPTREQVLHKIRSVYVADTSDSPWSLDYGTLHALYDAAYGLEHPFEMIPIRSRYFWLPILSKSTPAAILDSFPDRMHAQEFSSGEEARRYLNERYPNPNSGDAWVVRLDDRVIIMNSRENWDVDQAFNVPMAGRITKLAGRVGVNSYLIIQQANDALWAHLNGRPEKTQVLDLWVPEKPRQISVTPAGALETSSWDATDHRLHLRFLLNLGAVNAKIGF